MRWILFLAFLTSCGGYRFTQQDNPLAQYGIKSLSIPMFHNYSNQSDVSVSFTRETYRLLTGFGGLKLSSGHNPQSDAVLIGIIRSPEKVSETLRPGSLEAASVKASTAIGNDRQKFYVPITTEVAMSIQVIVIKKPTEEELALLKSGLSQQVLVTSRVIFNETIPLKTQYAREIFDKNAGNEVNATQNAGIRRKVMGSLAEQAAISIRDIIFYAF
jgi:hypothetical protein